MNNKAELNNIEKDVVETTELEQSESNSVVLDSIVENDKKQKIKKEKNNSFNNRKIRQRKNSFFESIKNLPKQEKKKCIRMFAFTSFFITISTLMAVAGIFLIGFGFKSFLLFDGFLKYYYNHTGGLDDFWEALSNLNTNQASSNEWAGASIDLFAPGVVLLIIGIVGIIGFILFFQKSKRKIFSAKDEGNDVIKVISNDI